MGLTIYRFAVLGPMKGWWGDEPLTMGSPQQQAMLAVLLLRPGHAANATELLDALWGDAPPRSAVTTVRTYAWRWRRTLDVDPAGRKTLLSLGDGYRLALPPGSVDADQAEEQATRAERSRRAGQLEVARDLLDQALSAWRGEPLAGVPGPFAEQQRHRLRETRLAWLEERIELDVVLGRAGRCIPELTALLAAHPLRERLYALLMRAYHSAGRQADAFALFGTARTLLAEELGVDPGPELTRLHQRLLRNEIEPATCLSADASTTVSGATAVVSVVSVGESTGRQVGPATPRSVPAQLPPDPADFTGRATVTEAIAARLTGDATDGLRVVAVAGMGGVGKTSLALHVAHRVREEFPDGQLYADLRGTSRNPVSSNVVLGHFLLALGLKPEDTPSGTEVRTALFRSMISGRRLLVVIDDVRDLTQVRPLLPGTSGCAVLITSRSRLTALPGTTHVALDVFAASEAVALLGRVVGADRVTAEPEAAASLVDLCGRLPLAVRIAAARLAARPGWAVADLNGKLADARRRLDELCVDDLAVRAAFDLAHRQLTPSQARAFALLSVVDAPDVSSATGAALLRVSGHQAEDLLEALVDAALLESPAARRYRYHDLLRVFARQVCETEYAQEMTEAVERLSRSTLASALAAFRHAVPGDPISGALGGVDIPAVSFDSLADARSWIAAETPTVVALATRIAEAPEASPLCGHAVNSLIALTPFGTVGPQLVEAAGKLVDAIGETDDIALGRAHFLCGHLALAATRLDEAERHIRRAIAASRATQDLVVLRQCVNDLGLIFQLLNRYDEAVVHYDEAVALARRLGHRSGEMVTTMNAALTRIRSGQAETAVTMCRRALTELEDVEDPSAAAYARYVLGLALHSTRDYKAATRWFASCLDVCDAAGLTTREAHARYRLADTWRELGQPERALTEAAQALTLCEKLGDQRDLANALLALGRVLLDLGRAAEGRVRLRRSYEIFSRLGLPDAAEVSALLAGSH
ncbi:AfsR/SARP family transcriptional regulator [Micromonospora marina]|uniref:AfsR/SARP family transcriptional regulator n=1 Tax=Micromonospora marina TaxID=307120 RepID=UPI00345256B8